MGAARHSNRSRRDSTLLNSSSDIGYYHGRRWTFQVQVKFKLDRSSLEPLRNFSGLRARSDQAQNSKDLERAPMKLGTRETCSSVPSVSGLMFHIKT